jgi:hypothetical protein
MAIVVDYTGRIDPAVLRRADVVGVCRYLSWLPNDKVIQIPEYISLTQGGIQVTLNWEFDALDWTHGGNGGSHGREAVRQARALGYPEGNVIVGSADFNMTFGQWTSNGRAYARGFAQAVRDGGYRPGVYGPWDVLMWVKAEQIMDAFWQSMSTAHSGEKNANPFPGGHLWQKGHRFIGGSDTDWNEIRITPLWGGSQGIDVDVLYRLPNGGIFAPTVNGPVEVDDTEYRRWGSPPYRQLDSVERLQQYCPAVSVSVETPPPVIEVPTAAEIAGEILRQLGAGSK